MKKLAAILLIAVMVLTSAVASSADGFIRSPSLNDNDPEFISEEHDRVLIITPYRERDTLPPEKIDLIEEAYDSIKGTDDLKDICPDLEGIADDKGIPTENLKVSDLFDISYYEDGHGIYSGHFRIKMKDHYLDNFVSLMVYYEEEWHVLNAKVTDGVYLEFDTDYLGAFAVVVNAHPDSPQTGNTFPWIYAAIACVLAAGAVVCFIVSKKSAKEQ